MESWAALGDDLSPLSLHFLLCKLGMRSASLACYEAVMRFCQVLSQVPDPQ